MDHALLVLQRPGVGNGIAKFFEIVISHGVVRRAMVYALYSV